MSKPKFVTASEGTKLTVLGMDHMTVKLSGADTNNQFTLIRQLNVAGVGIPRHIHNNEDEIFIVVSGELKVTAWLDYLEGTGTLKGDSASAVSTPPPPPYPDPNVMVKYLKAGDVAYLPKGYAHSYEVTKVDPGKTTADIWLLVVPAGLEKMFAELSVPGLPMEEVGRITHSYGVDFV